MLKKYDAHVVVIIIIISLIMIFWGKELGKDEIKKDLDDYDFTLGVVEVYFYRAPVGNNVRFSSITYSYIVNNIRHVKNYDALYYKLPSSPSVNDKFIVAYNKKDPQKSLLLGDYPIKNDEDFNGYIRKGIKINF